MVNYIYFVLLISAKASINILSLGAFMHTLFTSPGRCCIAIVRIVAPKE